MSDCTLISSTGGVRVAVHDFGGPDDPAAPVILFSHPTGFHGRVFGPTAARLTDRYRCLAVDLRGHGASETPPGASFSWAHLGEDISAVLRSDLVGSPREVHGVGHSMGGAALVIATAQQEPGRLRSLWLYEPAIPGPRVDVSGDEDRLAGGAARRRSSFASYEEAFANYAGKFPLNELDPEALMAYVRGGFVPMPDGGVILRCSPATEAAVFRAGSVSGAWKALSALDLPVTVVSGRPGLDSAFARPIVAELPRGTLLERPHLGHFGPLQDPPGTARDIADWVGANR